jgi:RND family efflux transporter MFP subunit
MKFLNRLKSALSSAGRVVVTLVVVFVAAVVVWNLWIYYQESPRTQDGRVRAHVVAIAADVGGQVVQVAVHDNQTIRKGDVLFRIDPSRYTLARDQARAALANTQAALEQAKRDAARYAGLGTVATVQQTEQSATAAVQAQAAVDQANVALQLAQLNLDRSTVISPVNGIVTNLNLGNGAYVGAGAPVMAVVDSDSFYVAGYFEETKLPNIHVGDPAEIRLMGDSRVLHGHVSGIAAAIGDPDRTTDASLLPNVNPTFTWVRLAQRVPVNVRLDDVPEGLKLVAGRSASVDITPKGAPS